LDGKATIGEDESKEIGRKEGMEKSLYLVIRRKGGDNLTIFLFRFKSGMALFPSSSARLKRGTRKRI